MGNTAWVAGGSGLVGGALLERLLADEAFARVVSVGRRTLPRSHPRLAQAVVAFGDPCTFQALDRPDVAFCALGTTARKAGSRAAFRAVDRDAVLAVARAARARGARVFVHVSALGADPRSRVFYNAVKGEAEEGVVRVGFESAYALRPSILDGDRQERRPGERAALAVGRVLAPLLGRYRPTSVDAVAAAMIRCAEAAEPGTHVVDAAEIPRVVGR